MCTSFQNKGLYVDSEFYLGVPLMSGDAVYAAPDGSAYGLGFQ